MPHESLGDFLSVLQDAGELVRIAAPVDSALEIAEITRRLGAGPNGGPALFFESVRGSSIPVVTNLLGSRSRLCRALGVRSLEELADRLTASPAADAPGRWRDAFKLSPLVQQLSQFAPKVLKTAYCQQIVKLGRDVNLWELPVPRNWPDEPQPVITLGQVITRCPVSQRRGVGLFPVQVIDQQRLVPCWHRHETGYQHWQKALAARQQLPVAIVLGGHPTSPLSAMSALPPDADPFHLGGLLHGGQTEVVKCRTSDLEVPAHAEIVIEGMVDPEAPLQPPAVVGLSTGFYAARPDPLPVIQVTAVTHRANPIFPSQVLGPPPSEDCWMRLAMERLYLPWIRFAAPEIVEMHAPVSGGGRSWLFVSIQKTYPQQSHKVLHALWSHPATLFTKGIVVVDDDVDLQASDDVWFAVSAHVDPERDLVVASGPADIDDHAGPIGGAGRKWGIDATRKLPEERPSRPWPKALTMSDAMRQHVTTRWKEFGLSPREETAP